MYLRSSRMPQDTTYPCRRIALAKLKLYVMQCCELYYLSPGIILGILASRSVAYSTKSTGVNASMYLHVRLFYTHMYSSE